MYGGCICYAVTHPRSGLDRFDLVITLRHDYYPVTPHAQKQIPWSLWKVDDSS